MRNVGITGASGFLGWHLRAHVHARRDVAVRHAGRMTFANEARLVDFVTGCDTIVHLAGMNRGEEAEIEHVNVSLTERLIAACEKAAVQPHVVFANSTHFDRDSAYGRAKRRSAELLAAWSTRSGARFTDLVLPGVFGEHGRPFYNSVVSTFCHQLAQGEQPAILEDREIELVHAQTVVARMVAAIETAEAGRIRVTGRKIKVGELANTLSRMSGAYRQHLFPDVADPFHLALFNSYRSYLFPTHYPVRLELKTDVRGSLFEAVRTVHGGQCFMSSSKPGVTRGNHYHTGKIERFLVVQGEALIRVRRLFSDVVTEFRVSGSEPAYVDMPSFHTHNITNLGSGELLTLFWAHEIFDPQHPDTWPEPV
jgi:UDP-2-acetamido-2,6-beta-L-arabino-hexul-4-ose reductase